MMTGLVITISLVVSLLIVAGASYLFFAIRDYRKYFFAGIGFSFLLVCFGQVFVVVGWQGSWVSELGNISLFVITGTFILIRAGDEWMQKRGFYIKDCSKKQHNKKRSATCQTNLSEQRMPLQN